jgi:Uma2 family endonuclease
LLPFKFAHTIILIAAGLAMVVQIDRKLFTVTEYQQMIETGILQEGDRCELLNGEMIKMAAIGRKHAAKVDRINRLLNRILQETIIVRKGLFAKVRSFLESHRSGFGYEKE